MEEQDKNADQEKAPLEEPSQHILEPYSPLLTQQPLQPPFLPFPEQAQLYFTPEMYYSAAFMYSQCHLGLEQVSEQGSFIATADHSVAPSITVSPRELHSGTPSIVGLPPDSIEPETTESDDEIFASDSIALKTRSATGKKPKPKRPYRSEPDLNIGKGIKKQSRYPSPKRKRFKTMRIGNQLIEEYTTEETSESEMEDLTDKQTHKMERRRERNRLAARRSRERRLQHMADLEVENEDLKKQIDQLQKRVKELESILLLSVAEELRKPPVPKSKKKTMAQ